ncbi:hypothetical protein [Mycolicibacterium goodii]|uniref:Uncharacterized protein n=1 Tax=Mycolicibacterium goodii TaxID=134601 RepID=A0A0K0X6H1_MYCGD|nr:hypothetical protein AFA91_15030 [Mycolicibacterium goodii]
MAEPIASTTILDAMLAVHHQLNLPDGWVVGNPLTLFSQTAAGNQTVLVNGDGPDESLRTAITWSSKI